MIIGTVAFVGVLILCLIVLLLPATARKNSPEQVVQPVFFRIYGTITPCPALKVTWSYGYPAFEITFVSKADFECAADRNREFKRELSRLFVRYGSVDRPFDAELATFFNYPGRIQELLAGKCSSPYVEPKRSVI